MSFFNSHSGAIDGSLFTVYEPTSVPHNGHVLIFAHGCRPEGIALDSNLDLNDVLYQRLLRAGWILAGTSYRREGIIVRDAVDDVIALHTYISEKYGRPEFSLLEGCSMGGCISTHVSERHDCPFDAVMALGAALLAVDAENPLRFSHSPKRPLLFITNSDETTLIEKYQADCAENGSGVTPATWTVYRIGHDNVSHLERESGLEFLLSWSRAGKIEDPAMQFSFDATRNVPIRHTTLFYDDEGAWGKVTSTSPWGDIHTDITPQDMEKLGILDGKEFTIELGATRFLDRGYSVKVKRVSHFVNAKQGEWCAYDTAEGIVVISKNGYASVHLASAEANVQAGSSVHILRPVGVGAQLMKIPGRLAARFFPASNSSSPSESITA